MNNNNTLDSYLQGKIAEADFAFEEAHWQHALARLQDDDNKKPIVWWRNVMLIIALLGAGLGAYLWANNGNTNIAKNIKTETKPATIVAEANNNIVAGTTMSNTKVEAKSTIKKETTTASNTPAPEKVILNNQNNTSNNIVIKKEAKQSKGQKIASVLKNILPKKEKIETPIANVEPIIKKEKTVIVKTDIKKEKVSSSSIINKIAKNIFAKKEPKQIIAKVNEPKIVKEKNIKANSKKPQVVKIENPILENKNNAIAKTQTEYNDQRVNTNFKKALTADEQQALNKRYVGHAKNYKQNIVELNKYDTIMMASHIEKPQIYTAEFSAKMSDQPKEPKQALPSAFSKKGWVANASLSRTAAPLNVYNNIKAHNIAPWLSCGYYWPINNKLSLQTMIGFTYLAGLSFESTIQKINQGGSDSSTYKIINKSLYQLYTPITLHYLFSKNQSVFGGMGLEYNMNVLSKEQGPNSAALTNVYGYKNAYRQFDAFVTLGYQYQILRNMYANISFLQGFSDFTKNSVQANTIKDRNSRINIGVTVKIK
jgi:hypothetical protein